MAFIPATMPEQIENIKTLEISYRVLHPTIDMKDKVYNKKITFPFSSIISKYKDHLSNIIVNTKLTEKEQETYMFKPKRLSEDLYGTTELWDTILLLNDCAFTSEFKPKILRVYDPARFKTFINEIMLLEAEQGNINY